MKGVANDMASTYLKGLADWPADTQGAVDKAIAVFAKMPGDLGQKAQDIAKIFHDLNIALPDDKIQAMADQLGIPFQTLKAAINQVPSQAQQGFGQAQAPVGEFGTTIQALGPTIGTIGNAFQQTFGVGIPSIIQAALPAITTAFQTIPTNLAPMLGEVGNLFQQTFGVGIPSIINTALPQITTAFQTMINTIAPIIAQIGVIFQQVVEVGLPASITIAQTGILAAFNTIVTTVIPQIGTIATAATNNFRRSISSEQQP